MEVKVKSSFKILDFDVECRPLTWIGADYVSKEVTAIGAKFIGSKKGKCWLLGKHTAEEMLEGFLEMYNEAGMVTGHYIRGFDLPVINGALWEFGYAPLGSKLTSDTKGDLMKQQGLSMSQENIGIMNHLEHPKVHIDWRRANRLEPDGMKLTEQRVMGDIEQHIELRASLLAGGHLGPPVLWDSFSKGKTKYQP